MLRQLVQSLRCQRAWLTVGFLKVVDQSAIHQQQKVVVVEHALRNEQRMLLPSARFDHEQLRQLCLIEVVVVATAPKFPS
jgi:hypothetical protein